jgi:hypothetical protein
LCLRLRSFSDSKGPVEAGLESISISSTAIVPEAQYQCR